jgi:hypothetical protein
LSPQFPHINFQLLFSHPTATAARFALTLSVFPSQVYSLPLLISHWICGFDFLKFSFRRRGFVGFDLWDFEFGFHLLIY